ncbi:MAG: 50S ribosomal protein L10 [Planctomycetes bacterium]|nr:50S ribosomal protein L10 [Planctomycetota bacterium]
MSKELRNKLVAETTKRFTGQQHAILVNYAGLSAGQMAALRDILRKEKIRLTVLKNSTAALAFKSVGFEALNEKLSGQNALVYGVEDPSQLARSVFAWKDKNPKLLEIKGGMVEGRPATAKDLKAIADLPTRPVLLAMLLGALNGSARGLAVSLNGVAAKFARALKAVADQKSAAAGAAGGGA